MLLSQAASLRKDLTAAKEKARKFKLAKGYLNEVWRYSVLAAPPFCSMPCIFVSVDAPSDPAAANLQMERGKHSGLAGAA